MVLARRFGRNRPKSIARRRRCASANIAGLLAAAGRRVAVVDTDVQSPGIHVLFGFDRDPPTPTINNYLYGATSIVDVAHDVSGVLPDLAPGSLWLVPASMDVNEIAKVLRTGYDVELLHEGFRDLIAGLDLHVLVLDTHPGINEETLLSITVSDTVVLLLRPDKQDFQGAAVTVDIARRLQVPELLMVVNKVPSSIDLGSAAEQVATPACRQGSDRRRGTSVSRGDRHSAAS